jgi:hypothetical protein
MGRIDPDPSASDDQAVTDRKNDFVHGLLAIAEMY